MCLWVEFLNLHIFMYTYIHRIIFKILLSTYHIQLIYIKGDANNEYF
jgi:hypothetical protein